MKSKLIILFVILSGMGFSQSHTFNVANPFWLYPINSQVVEIGNYYYCLGGYYSGNQRILIIKYDLNGNIVQTKDYGDTISSYAPVDLIIYNENNLFATIYRSQYVIFDQYSAPVILEFDTNLTIKKEKIYPLKFNGFSFIPVKINNSIYMTGGTAYDSILRKG